MAHWFLALDHPLRAVTIGNHCVSHGVWETSDTIQTILDWIDCVRARRRPNTPAEAGVSAAAAALLGNQALRRNAVARWGK